MRKVYAAICLLLLSLSSLAPAQHKPLKRSESFFGFHFDFHATENDREIGKTLTAGMIDSLLNMTNPDFIQVDCKGHPGCSSYPTKVGNQAGGYTQDILKLFRQETEKYNVALYVHYSGVWDEKAIREHPGWAIVRADGSRDKSKTSFFSGYLDSLMIPQLRELSGDYHVDGAWIDGDCWAMEPDYSPLSLKEFRETTGITTIPRTPEDSLYKAFLEFTRGIFRRHATKYIDAIHRFNPNFQITSNWAFSSLMPEKVSINVDYLSGDVAGQNCVNNAAFQARCLALQGKPWDLMSWSFGYAQKDGFFVPKTTAHLEQEAAEVMAMGGGFQSYWAQNRDGSLKSWNFSQMAELARFCRARQRFCQGSETIPQIALWYSVESWKKSFNGVYAGGTGTMEAILTMILDGQHTVDVLMDHQLAERLSRYRLLVIPEWAGLDPQLKDLVLQYAADGGKVLVVGASAVREFEPALGVTTDAAPRSTAIYIGYTDNLSGIKSSWLAVRPKPGTESIGSFYAICDSRSATGNPVASIARYGKGEIAGIYVNLGDSYYGTRSPVYERLMNDVIARLLPDPALRISGSEHIHAVLSRKGSRTLVHLINTAGEHFNSKVFTYDEVPHPGSLTVEYRCAIQPSSVLLQPAGTKPRWSWKSGMLTVTVPTLEIYSIVEIAD